MDCTKKINSWQKKIKKPCIVTHFLISIFGSSAWIGVNGIFIQLPLLVNTLPEKWQLASYIVIIIQLANIIPIIYSILQKYYVRTMESYFIFIMLGIGCFTLGLLPFLYDITIEISGQKHSVVFLMLTFTTATVSCSSSVLFMPYIRNFQEVYLISYFIGEGLSGVLPSIIALVQGIDGRSSCNNSSYDIEVLNVSEPKFSSKYYFIFLFICLSFSLLSFILLENFSYIKGEKIILTSTNNFSKNDSQNSQCQREKSIISEYPVTNSIEEEGNSKNNYKKTDDELINNCYHVEKCSELKFKNLYLYILLSLICLLANGLLPSLQPYSCLSYGNQAYHLSAIFSQIANPTACFLALWILPRNRKIIIYLSLMIFTVSSYIIYVAFTSPYSPLWRSNLGKPLIILLWTLLTGLISYIKLFIASVLRKNSEKSLFLVGVTMQAGSALGAFLSFILINNILLQDHKLCNV